MPAIKLTARAVPRLRARPDGRRRAFYDAVVRGLILDVHASGKMTYSAWYRVRGTGKAGRLTLGRHVEDVFGLADARDAAREALRLAALGRDPAEERRRTKQASVTFGDLVKAFLAGIASKVRPATLASWAGILGHDRLAGLRSERVVDVGRGELVRLFDQIRDDSIARGGKGYSANRTLEAVRRAFSWAVEEGLVGASPCVGIKKRVKEHPRDRAYTDAELGAVVRALDESAMSDAVRLCLLTGVRIEQALGAPWSEFDAELTEWRIAAERAGNKSGVPWLVPIVPAAADLLRRRRADEEFVFAARSRRPENRGETVPARRRQWVVRGIRERSGVEDFRPHDLRRTLNSWLASRAGGAETQSVRDAILGHRPPGMERVYNVHGYADEKKAALERWAAHVVRVAAAEPAKIIQMAS